MEYSQFGDVFVIRLDRGDEIITSVTDFCKKENVKLGYLEGIGASDYAVIGLYDVTNKKYHKTEIHGIMEITSLIGNITTKEGEVYLHLHINLCDKTMSVKGGHLNECRVSATSEIIVRKIDGYVGRYHDVNVTGLNIFEFL